MDLQSKRCYMPFMEEFEWMAELGLQIKDRKDPWIVLEGRDAVEAAMSSWWDIVGILADEACDWDLPDWSGLVVSRCKSDVLKRTAGQDFGHDVVGLARLPDELGDVKGLMSELGEDATVVVCPRMAEPGNVGAVIQNAAALGAEAVIFGEECLSPFEREVVVASGLSVFKLPIRLGDSGQVLRCLKAAQFTLLGTSGDQGVVDLGYAESIEGRVALVIGSEAEGLGSFWLRACDRLVRIPVESGMDSINPASASAVCLWDLKRLREIGLDELEDF
jgi:tRNA G18 (ribose-2'-O)-methylase SpoU